MASFFTALQTFVQQRNTDTLQEVTSWILGSLPNTGWSDVIVLAPYVLVTTAVIVAHRRVVDVLSLGDIEAASLGVDVRRVRFNLVVAATIGTAAAVAVSGLIAFVGIIVPHAIRMLTGTSYRGLLPLSFVVGAGFLILADVIARTALSGGGADRCRHRADRRSVLRARAAHPREPRVSAIALDGVTVRLGGRPVVDDVSATVEAGEWVALIGPNGAGKTSLLRAIAGLLPCEGRVVLDGRPAASLERRERARQLAVVPQEPETPPWLTVAEYVLLGRTPHLGPLAREGAADREAAWRALERLDLEPLVDRPLGTLSGGERQRAVVARALAQEAPVVLLDEPTAALDIGHQQQALELLDGSVRRRA